MHDLLSSVLSSHAWMTYVYFGYILNVEACKKFYKNVFIIIIELASNLEQFKITRCPKT